jgi:preprotein translocase subunit SecB
MEMEVLKEQLQAVATVKEIVVVEEQLQAVATVKEIVVVEVYQWGEKAMKVAAQQDETKCLLFLCHPSLLFHLARQPSIEGCPLLP